MTVLSASDAQVSVVSAVKKHWKTTFELHLARTVRQTLSWRIEGVLSRPTSFAPIPSAVVNVTFEVTDEAEEKTCHDVIIRYRLENVLHWRDIGNFTEAMVDRMLSDKMRISDRYQDIVRDDFGATRGQIAFQDEIEEENQIVEAARKPVYDDDSEDDYLPDEDLLGPLDEDSEDDDFNFGGVSQEVVNMRESIDHCVAEAFSTDLGRTMDPSIQYFTALERVQDIGHALNATTEDYMLMYACVEKGMDLHKIAKALANLLKRRLTSSQHEACSDAWPEFVLNAYSPELTLSTARACAQLSKILIKHTSDKASKSGNDDNENIDIDDYLDDEDKSEKNNKKETASTSPTGNKETEKKPSEKESKISDKESKTADKAPNAKPADTKGKPADTKGKSADTKGKPADAKGKPADSKESKTAESKEPETHEFISRTKLRAILSSQSVGLRAAEINTLMALQQSHEVEVDLIKSPSPDELGQQMRNVRLAFARHVYMCYSSSPVGVACVEKAILSSLLKMNLTRESTTNEGKHSYQDDLFVTNEDLLEALLSPRLATIVHNRITAARALARVNFNRHDIAAAAVNTAQALCSLGGDPAALEEATEIRARNRLELKDLLPVGITPAFVQEHVESDPTAAPQQVADLVALCNPRERLMAVKVLLADSQVAQLLQAERAREQAYRTFVRHKGQLKIVGVRPVEDDVELTVVNDATNTEACATFSCEQLASDFELHDTSVLTNPEHEDSEEVLERIRKRLYVDAYDASILLYYVPLLKRSAFSS